MPSSPSAVLCSTAGVVTPLLVDRWTAAPTSEELRVLDRAASPVLDVGCGPGRHVAALAARGLIALGIDISPEAVAAAERLGSIVLRRSVFQRLPNEGLWRTALLIDGNIGIGGDPVALLGRLRTVIVAGGSVLVELDGPGKSTTVDDVRVERGHAVGPWFAWARVSIDDIDRIAGRSGFTRTWTHEEADRWFVELTS